MAKLTRPTSFQVVGGALTLAEIGGFGNETIVGLRELEVANGQRVTVKRYEGGSPELPLLDYIYVAGATNDDDGGSIIRKTDGSGVFKYIGLQKPSVELYGAYGDGVHDDAPAIMRAAEVHLDLHFFGDVYNLKSSIQFKLNNQKFHLGRSTLQRERSSEERTAGTSVNLFDYTVSWREHCHVIGGTLRAHASDRGFVHGVYSVATIYSAVTNFESVTFDRSLGICVYANTILCKFSFCTFGVYGTAGAIHMHIRQNGQPPVGSNLTPNGNTWEFCRFFHATGVEYGIELGDGFMNSFIACDYEQNSPSVAMVNNKGSFLTTFEYCWSESNTGASFLRLAMDSGGVTQGPLIQTFRNCWLKAHTGNTCITNSATQNISVEYIGCAGAGWADLPLTKVSGVSDAEAKRFQKVKGCRFTGKDTEFSPNSETVPTMTAYQFDLRSTAGALNASIVADSSRLNFRHDLGASFQTLDGKKTYCSIVTTETGAQARFLSQNGTEMKLQPPTDGTPGPAQWTAV